MGSLSHSGRAVFRAEVSKLGDPGLYRSG